VLANVCVIAGQRTLELYSADPCRREFLEKMRNMKKLLTGLVIVGLGFAGTSLTAAAASSKTDLSARLAAATSVINEVMATPDKAIPNQITEKATCIAVVPSMKKAAFLVGGQYGQGVVTCRTPHGWSAPVFFRIAGGSFGFQIGGQATDLVLVAVNDKGFQDLLKNKVKLGGDAAASAGPVGRNAQAGTDWKLNAEILTYSRSKGLFAGIDLTGDEVSQNTDDTTTFYGGNNTAYQEILKGGVAVPEAAKPFVRTVAKYFHSTQD
jgi:lipid-binding SYLF domain-containing protein